ncbi:hypothetical protein SAMN05192543_104304 [Paraburkholderia megapolitana]|uniref:Uncharacterized protein n=1 Tax=Paraburkholderia megapolitana TaxID=420953 RepID=A0A1I3LA48_9BURK|nr:hypothetical protein SAMN05192543_104304 [Paraburkholderia megapolitana]
MFVSWASDCEPIAVAPLATVVTVAPFTPATVPACAQVPTAVVSAPLAEPQVAAFTVDVDVLSNVRPCVVLVPVPLPLPLDPPAPIVEIVVERPVDSEVLRLPVEVDRLFRLLLVVERPVDSDEI